MSKRKSKRVATAKAKPGCASVNGYDSTMGELMILAYASGQYAEEARELWMKVTSLHRRINTITEQIKAKDGGAES